MTSVAHIVVRALVTLFAIVAAAGQVSYLDALWWRTLGWTAPIGAQMSSALLTLMTAHAVVSIVSAAFAVALVQHEGPRQAAARGLGLAIGAWSYLLAYSGITLLLRPDPGAARTAFEAHFLVVEMIGLAGLLRFSGVFPRALGDLPLPAPDASPGPIRPLHSVSLWMLRPSAPWTAAVALLAGLWAWTVLAGRPLGDAGLTPAMDVARFAAIALVVLNLRRSWATATPDGATRLSWLMVALVLLLSALLLFIGGNVLMAVTRWAEPAVAWRPLLMDLGLLGFLGALTASVLYRGSRDPQVLARRLAALTTVAAAGLFLAAGLEALFAGGMLAGFSLRTGAGTVVAFVTVVSTYRGVVRALERIYTQLPTPQVVGAPPD